MGYLDAQLEFSDNQDLGAAGTGANASTNVIDTQSDEDVGPGEELYLVIGCLESVTSAGAATVDFQLETDDNEAMASATIKFSTGPVAKAAILIGENQVTVALPHGLERFIRVNFEVGTAALTAGKFDAFLTKDPEAWTPKADALAAL